MSKAATAKNWPIGRAPALVTLNGDKARPESAEHIIEFPGGAIAVTRTSDDNYWAHIVVNATRKGLADNGSIRESVQARVIGSRIGDCNGVRDIAHAADVEQIAVLIGPAPREAA